MNKTKIHLILTAFMAVACNRDGAPGKPGDPHEPNAKKPKVCDVSIDRGSPGRIARTAYLMAVRCTVSEDDVVERIHLRSESSRSNSLQVVLEFVE